MKKSILISVFLILVLAAILAACAPDASTPCNATKGSYTIKVGEVGYQPNFNYDPRGDSQEPRYVDNKLYSPGEKIDLATQKCEPVAKVPQGLLGRRIGEENLYDPGTYNNIPASEMRNVEQLIILPGQVGLQGDTVYPPGTYRLEKTPDILILGSTTLEEGWMAIYQDASEQYVVLDKKGTYDSVPNTWPIFYPSGSTRFRTLWGGAWTSFDEAGRDPKHSACASFVCERSTDKVNFSDSNVVGQGVFDVDILFHFDTSNPEALLALGDPETAVQNLIGTPLRSFGRIGFANHTSEWFESPAGRSEAEKMLFDNIVKSIGGAPIILDGVYVRSSVIGDEATAARLAEAQAALAESKLKADQLAQDAANQELQQEIDADQKAFEREQAMLDAQNQAEILDLIFKAVGDRDWQLVAILFNYLKINPAVNLDGSPVGPTNNP